MAQAPPVPEETPNTISIDGPSPPLERLPPGTRLDRYIVMTPLGEGGAGIVYAAFDPELDRKVALKLVRASERTQARLLREAQAMARLSHPNVVAVYDVGTLENRVFVAMEFVDGWTLRQWLQQSKRSWRDVMAAYLSAGRGLVAAHAAGLVHRDFKPDNVLVGRDGSVRVTDFGLVRAGPASDDDLHEPEAPREARPLDARLTQVNAVVGTPGYMAPEQFRSTQTDARTDQWAFCAALYEALYGRLPFFGETVDEVREATCAGKLPPPDRSKVPTRIHRAIARGLSLDPAARFPAMEELLHELARDPSVGRRRAAMVIGVVGAIAASAFVAHRASTRQEQMCRGAEAHLGGVWDAAQRRRVESAFTSVGLPYASQAFATVAAVLDRFAGDWVAMRTEACEAAQVRGEQSEQILTLRMSCLDTRLKEMRSLVELMASADRPLVAGSVEAVGRLSPVAACGDVVALTAPVAPPADARSRAEVEALRGKLAEARSLANAGKFEAAERAEGPLVIEARRLRYVPVLAEVMLDLGLAQQGAGRYDVAATTLRDALDAADEAHHDDARGRALLGLADVQGRWLGNYARAEEYASGAVHVARRLGNARMESVALELQSREHGYMGALDRAIDEARQSIALTDKLFGPDDLRRARVHNALSIALAELGRFDEAEREDRLALEVGERALGPNHPELATFLQDIGLDLVWSGRPAEALPIERRAGDIVLRELGPDHPQYANVLNNYGYAETQMGHFAEGLDWNAKSLAIYEQRLGPDHAENAYPLVGMGEDLVSLGHADRALPLLERATRLAESHALDAETLGECHFHFGRALWDAGRDRARARALVTQSIADYSKAPRLAARAERARAWLVSHDAAARAATH
jgi:tetratricopeptide (TPR) repeat protein